MQTPLNIIMNMQNLDMYYFVALKNSYSSNTISNVSCGGEATKANNQTKKLSVFWSYTDVCSVVVGNDEVGHF